ncbi:MAG: sulfotransferase [Gammaproteobacteria bacterium]|nr:sulfotransferase [Gammaproteobacteria bacterium]
MAVVETGAAGTPPQSESRRIRGLIERREFLAALAAAEVLLAANPGDRDALYLAAVAERRLGRIDAALHRLERLERAHEGFGRGYQEVGHCQLAAGQPAAALEAYRRAVAANGSLGASWRALAALARAAGRNAEAEAAEAEVARLARLPPAVVAAAGMIAEGDLEDAERVLRRFLQTQMDHVEAMRLLAQIGVRHEVLDDAEFLLESALAFQPDHLPARYEYASVLAQRHKHAQALAEADRLLEREPGNRAFRIIRANACVGLGRQQEALEIFRDLLAGSTQAADLHLSIGHAEKTLGRQSEAVSAYRRAAEARPGFGDAYWSLANLKTYRFTDAEIAAMGEFVEAPTTGAQDRYHFCFALGKALEDRGEYAASFGWYERGNALKKAECRYSADVLERTLALQYSVCTREFLESRADCGCADPSPIFIVGLPRAGSTLLEQILASHPLVEGTAELAEIPQIVQHLAGREIKDSPPRYPAVLRDLEPARLRELGERYIAETRVYRGGKSRFIDKMPNNFRHLGLIRLILPNARIIDARREPMACCFSNFKQLFASGQEFTYGLADIGRYYRSYVSLMDHWERVMPGRILRVQHEALVEDFEAQVRRLLDFCGLEFDPACLEFHRNARSVRTASSEQVRRPINREGLDQWRHFEPWLAPLREALGPLAG